MKYTYQEAYDKVIQAYYKDEILPYNAQFCFCGTLAPDYMWALNLRDTSKYPYTYREYKKMEMALLIPLRKLGAKVLFSSEVMKHPEYEEILFEGMCNALDELKKIHIERGENVECPIFAKRQLKLAI